MVAVPAATAVTTPVVAPTAATPVALDDQVPPLVASVKVAVVPVHMGVVPVMGDDPEVTIKVAVTEHPAWV